MNNFLATLGKAWRNEKTMFAIAMWIATPLAVCIWLSLGVFFRIMESYAEVVTTAGAIGLLCFIRAATLRLK